MRAAPESLPALAPAALGALKVVRAQARRHPLLAGVAVASAAVGVLLTNRRVRAKLAQLGPKKPETNRSQHPKPQTAEKDALLDESLKATFPASDPVGAKHIT